MPRDYRWAHEREQPPPRGNTRKALSVVLAVVIVGALLAILGFFRSILFPFIVAAILTYVLDPFVRRLVRVGFPRVLAVFLVILSLMGVVAGFGYYLFPKLSFEAEKGFDKLQAFLVDAPEMYERIEERFEGWVDTQSEDLSDSTSVLEEAAVAEKGAEQWGLGPNLHVSPENSAFDVPVLEEVELTASARDLVHSDSLQATDLVGSEFKHRTSEEAGRLRDKSHLIIDEIGDGSYGVRFKNSTFEIDEDATGQISISPREEPRPADRFGNLKVELVETIVQGVEGLASGFMGGFLGVVRAILQGLFGALIGVLLVFMVTAFMLLGMEETRAFFNSLVPPKWAAHYEELIGDLDHGLSGVVRGQILICLINGILSGIGFAFFIPEYAIAMAVLAGVMSLIPIFGTILSSIPVVLLGLTQSVMAGVAVLLWILGIHFIEANFLNPKIIGAAAHINPVLVIFALIAGEHAFGIPGALLAVPFTSVFQTFVKFTYVRIRPYLWEGLA